MFKKAEVRIEDGFAFGVTGWVLVVVVKDGVFGDSITRVGGLQFTDRKEAIRVYKLVDNLIKALQ